MDFILPFVCHAVLFWSVALSCQIFNRVVPSARRNNKKRTARAAVAQSAFNMAAVTLPFMAAAVPYQLAHAAAYPPSPAVHHRAAWFLVGLGVTDFSFYWVHRALHGTHYIYAKIHSKHHQWDAPVAVAATDSHWLEHLTLNLFPVFLGAHVARLGTIAELCAWSVLATANALYVHSGYDLPGVAFHDGHHKYHYCNFGVNGLSDKLFGTFKSIPLICATGPTRSWRPQ